MNPDVINYLVIGNPNKKAIKKILNNASPFKIKLYKSSTHYKHELQSFLGGDQDISVVLRSDFIIQHLYASRGKAFFQIDELYLKFKNNREVLESWAKKEFQNDEINRIFKKQLIELLGDLYEFLFIASSVFKGQPVSLVVDPFLSNVAALMGDYLDNKFTIIEVRTWKSSMQKFKSLSQLLLIPLYILSKVRRLTFNSVAEHKNIGIRIHKSIRNASKPLFMEGYDMIVPFIQKKGLSYLYVIESNPSKQVLDDLNKTKAVVVNMESEAFRNVTVSFLAVLAWEQLKIFFLCVKILLCNIDIFYELLPKILYDRLRWDWFTRFYSLNWYFSFNDDGKSHLTRNITLENHGVKTFSMEHSWSTKALFGNLRAPERAYTYYSVKSYIYEKQLAADNSQGALLKDSFLSGYLHDPFCIDSYQKYLNLISSFKVEEKKIITLFTASTGGSRFNDINDLYDFYYLINELISDPRFDDWIFLIKHKKLYDEHKSSHTLSHIIEKLLNSNRVFEVSTSISASFYIAISDFVISMAFTSPTLEALGLGIPSTFFAKKGKSDNSIFINNPEVIFTTPNELWKNFKYFSSLTKMEILRYYEKKLPLGCMSNQKKAGIDLISDYLAKNL